MRIIIFGATGGTGRELIQQAVVDGRYEVTAFARKADKLAHHRSLRVITGDVADDAAVIRALDGQDAVLSALGPATAQGFGRDPAVIEGIRHIVRAMEANGPRRLVYLSTLGVPAGRHQYSFFPRYVMAPTLLRGLIAEHDIKERIIRASGLDWTLVRPPMLTNGKRTEAYRQGPDIRARSVIPSCSRADVAHFMLQQAGSRTYLHKAVAVMR
jgi:putative NADH-flavin reductase